jgi:hypothetical protein
MEGSRLRTVLLVRSVEEADPDGVLVPPAERAAATRAALREAPDLVPSLAADDPRPALERFLEVRARAVLARLAPRHPVLATLGAGSERVAWAGRAVVALAFAFGAALSALDGRHRIDLLAFPLVGLIAWNLLVYGAIGVAALSRRPRSGAAGRAYLGLVARRLARRGRRAEPFDAPLGRALGTFAGEWPVLARPWLAARAERLFHVAALALALGLVAGLYWRGLTLEYRAGWESTFLGPAGVRRWLELLYGPAAFATGLRLPADDAAVAGLAWRAGGVPAAPWIHLLAATAVLWIVVPRALLAAFAGVRAWRSARATRLPPAALAYARELLAGEGVALGGRRVVAVPYACTPPSDGALARLLEAADGAGVRVDVAPTVPYGEESAFLAAWQPPPGVEAVAVFDLAATPESENHGVLLSGLRDRRPRGTRARPRAVIDGRAYARRLGPELTARVAERARLWSAFCADHGVEALVAVDGPAAAGPTAGAPP